MPDPIQFYNMPEEQSGKTFQFHEITDKTLNNNPALHNIGKPHRHKYYEIFIFIKGGAKHEIDFKTYNVKSHCIHFLSPGQVHQITRGDTYFGYEIIFNSDFYNGDLNEKESLPDLPFFNNNRGTPILTVNETEFNELMILVNEMKKECGYKRNISNAIIRALLHIFLIKCKYYFTQQPEDPFMDTEPDLLILSRFRSLIEQHFESRLTVKDYAEKMNLSPAVLNRKVKKTGGQNASEMIMDRLILEAKRLLMYTHLNNKEIAFRLNYEDPSYFSRVFKSKTGRTPSRFRAEMITETSALQATID
jgi:AraC-like DNA-binding protein